MNANETVSKVKEFFMGNMEAKKAGQIKEAKEEFDVTFKGDKVYIMHGADAILDVSDKSMEEIKTLLKSMQNTLLEWRGLN